MSSMALGSGFGNVVSLPKNASRNSTGGSFFIRGSAVSTPQILETSNVNSKGSAKSVRVEVLGESGYTGAEKVRLLASHRQFCITLMTADRKAGLSFGSVFPLIPIESEGIDTTLEGGE
ncbi:hypothetical protein KSP39_PZI011695 [Platanthera zijinensis]|uniref:Semialdehyde dehydrogenase NAD-binding domain-containing protein n=1 Tax=Platanthera zijinensis TaxID=2320716 RepID=A0AAP0BIH8_9ASPA